MRAVRLLLALSIATAVLSCRQLLGIEEATLVCPPEFPDCTLCWKPADCGAPTECHSWECSKNMCVPVNAPARTTCSTGVCSEDLVSECVQCVEYEDCPGGHCKNHVCSSCDDGIQNGFESGVDCGGGGPCKSCSGAGCLSGDTCKSGICADGTCCDTVCNQTCTNCNNVEGICMPLPKYSRDDDPLCSGDYVCNEGGLCLLRSGEICINGIECASGVCYKNRCRYLAGEPCIHPLECVEDLCVDGVCQQ
ncbi:MAG: hypothetical protein IPM54_24355 [Polyangiaceae bacterium]|nr:hypothetical protein [Polyangiaceae bacterium]